MKTEPEGPTLRELAMVLRTFYPVTKEEALNQAKRVDKTRSKLGLRKRRKL